MCKNGWMFATFKSFKKPQKVTLGDGHVLEATGEGIEQVKIKIPKGKFGGVTCEMYCLFQNRHTIVKSHCSSEESWEFLLPGMYGRSKSRCYGAEQGKTLVPPLGTPWGAWSD